MDLFQKCFDYKEVEWAKKRELYPYFCVGETVERPVKMIEGAKKIMMGSSNYLGLADIPEILEAGIKALEEYGSGCAGSRLLNGTIEMHIELEEEIADFVQKESALVLGTGFQANLGIISSLAGFGDYIVGDKECHASIYDACRLSYAKSFWYKHNDMADLERILSHIAGKGGILIVTDGVFSMSGEIANIPEIVRLARKYDARVMVDDAHGFGVIGEGGRGIGSYYNLTDEIDVYMGALSKAMASEGGFIAAQSDVVEYVKHNSRPFIFSSSPTPSNVATSLAAIQYLKQHPELPVNLKELADYGREKLTKAGVKIKDSITPIVPIYTYDMEKTFVYAQDIYKAGVYVNTVMPPAAETCLLRTTYMANFTKSIIEEAIDIILSII